MQSLCLTTARFCATAWVGAAVLFVITGVREVTSPEPGITSEVKDTLVPIRFNAYYLLGFVLVTAATACCALHLKHKSGRSKRVGVCMALLILALAAMVVDFLFIYSPLLNMITPAGGVKLSQFRSYHNASMYINAFDVGLCLIAALILCLPQKRMKS